MREEKITAGRILAALLGVFLVGVGVAFNNCAGLGNDPVGIIYDGIRNAGGMNAEQLGLASNLVNCVLTLFLWFAARRYISVGTLVYFIPYGSFVTLGTMLYGLLAPSESLAVRVGFSAAGCLLLYLGVAVYITADIGVDPFSGVVLWIRDVVKKEFQYVKIAFDLGLILLGTLLGGRLGVVTVATALAAGPLIQYFSGILKTRWMKNE